MDHVHTETEYEWARASAFLWLGRVDFDSDVWGVYFLVETAHRDGGRDLYAEDELFELMAVRSVMTD